MLENHVPHNRGLVSIYPELDSRMSNWKYLPEKDALHGKNILITGAGDGIGASLSKTYASFGANLLLLGRTRSRLEVLFDWIKDNTDTNPTIVPCDLELLDESMVFKLKELILENYEALNGLVNNASMLGPKVPIAHYPAEEWRRVFQVNAIAPFILTKGLFSLMDVCEEACVINTSSTVGRVGRAYWGAYSASKFALEGFSQILADETENSDRIKVYSINPGATRTKMRKEAYPLEDSESLPLPESYFDLYIALMEGNKHPLQLPVSGSQINAQDWIPGH